jgi:hypothetical protein
VCYCFLSLINQPREGKAVYFPFLVLDLCNNFDHLEEKKCKVFGCEMAEVKPEDMVHHPPMDQLQGFEYCIDSNPSWGEAIALGFQHYILSLGTAVMIPTMLVPLMGGNDHDKARVVQTLLFVTGIKTLLQTLFGTRLPTIIGGSYAFVVPILSIIRDPSLAQIADGHTRFVQTMRAIQGSLIVSSSIQIILGYSQLWAICSRYRSSRNMLE